MTPNLAGLYHADQFARDAIVCRDKLVLPAIQQNGPNLVLRKFGLTVPFPSCPFSKAQSVGHVLKARPPIQIVNMVIGFVSIAMANFLIGIAGTYKRVRHNAVQVKAALAAAICQPNGRIARWPDVWRHNLGWQNPATAGGISDGSFKRTNASSVRDFVKAFIANNGFPIFHSWKLADAARLVNIRSAA
jgi:hypothetical protein